MCAMRIRTSKTAAVPAARITMPVATLAPWSKARRAATWLAANAVDTPSRMTMPRPGDNFEFMKAAIICWLALGASATFACEYPDEGSMPLRRAVTKVQMLPEVEAMSGSTTLQYL